MNILRERGPLTPSPQKERKIQLQSVNIEYLLAKGGNKNSGASVMRRGDLPAARIATRKDACATDD
jgi:hypothetical protein